MLAHSAKPVLVKKKVSEEPSRSSWRTLGEEGCSARYTAESQSATPRFSRLTTRDRHVARRVGSRVRAFTLVWQRLKLKGTLLHRSKMDTTTWLHL